MGKALDISDADFDKKITQRSGIVLAVLYMDSCTGSSKMMSLLDKLSEQKGELLEVVKVDINKHHNNMMKLGVRGTPTMILFKNGEAVSAKVGAMPEGKLIEWVDSEISKSDPEKRINRGSSPDSLSR